MVCSNCDNDNFVTDNTTGDTICTGCGLVAEACMFDDRPEWVRGGGEDEAGGPDRARCGPAADPLLHNVGVITLDVRRAKGNVRNLQRYSDQMAMTYQERALYAVFRDMTTVCETALHLPSSIIFQAKEMYKDVKEARLSRGSVHKAVIAACVYYACKVQPSHATARSKMDVAHVFNVTEKSMSAACKIFREATRGKPYHAAMHATLQSRDMVQNVIASFTFPKDVRIRVTRTVWIVDDQIRNSGVLDGKSPNSVMAAVLSVVFDRLNIDISKQTIAAKCGTSLVTLNKMLPMLNK